MANKTTEIKYGDMGFGRVNDYPPARWKFGGQTNGVWTLLHVARPGQTPFPPQFVTWDVVERIMHGPA